MSLLRTHIFFTNEDGTVHSAKLKEENYDANDYEEMDLNAVERQMIHEKRIADEENAELEWQHQDDGDDMWESKDES